MHNNIFEELTLDASRVAATYEAETGSKIDLQYAYIFAIHVRIQALEKEVAKLKRDIEKFRSTNQPKNAVKKKEEKK